MAGARRKCMMRRGILFLKITGVCRAMRRPTACDDAASVPGDQCSRRMGNWRRNGNPESPDTLGASTVNGPLVQVALKRVRPNQALPDATGDASRNKRPYRVT